MIKRNNGIFYIVGVKKGRRVWQSLHTRLEEDARAIFEEHQRIQARSTLLRVRSFFDDFLERAPLALSPKTIEIYDRSFRNFSRLCGNLVMRHVSSCHAEQFKQKRIGEVSAVSVNIEYKALRAAFGDAQRLKVIEDNPFDGVKPVRVPHKEASFLTEPELRSLLSAIPDKDFRDVVQFAVHTMMRLGEICNLKQDQIDLARRVIRVKSSGQFRVKGGRPRPIPMSDWVYDLMSRRVTESEYVFLNRVGNPLVVGSLSKRIKRYVRKAGLSGSIHGHSLRHTGISWLINRGVPAAFVQKLAGHSSLLVTQLYTHLEDQNLAGAVRSFAAISTH
ncbi:MAG: site-specific integrase [Ignavibacteria bacterium]|nr:site-specific integrase [Ignavibacteria bacterium]